MNGNSWALWAVDPGKKTVSRRKIQIDSEAAQRPSEIG